MITVEEKYERLAKDIRTVLRAIQKAVTEGGGKFENGENIFYVTCMCGDFILHKADQLCGSVRLFRSEDCKLFMMTCLSYLEGDVV